MPGTGFWWILLSVGLYGLLHSLMAGARFKAAFERRLGQAIYTRFFRFFFVVTGGITFIPSLLLIVLLPDRGIYSIPDPWVYLTLFIQGAAAVEILLVVQQTGATTFLGVEQILRPGLPPVEKLVTDGLYHYVRHPLYTLSLLIIWLTPTLTWDILAFNLGVTAYLWIGSIFEERKLARQFGQDYEDYRRRTPRLLPGIKL